MAIAAEDHTTTPPTLCVISFDGNGNQTDDVLTVPLPAELLAIPLREWYKHKERMQQHLIESIGFCLGFIRVRDCRFPGDAHDYNRPTWDEPEHLGVLDSDDEESWQENPRGNGGEAHYVLRNGQYVFGWDRYADKRGRVHST
jgi:hypothetical protein